MYHFDGSAKAYTKKKKGLTVVRLVVMILLNGKNQLFYT